MAKKKEVIDLTDKAVVERFEKIESRLDSLERGQLPNKKEKNDEEEKKE